MANTNRQANDLSSPPSHSTSRFPSLRRPQSTQLHQPVDLSASAPQNTGVPTPNLIAAASVFDGSRDSTRHHDDAKFESFKVQPAESVVSPATCAETSQFNLAADVSSLDGGPGMITVLPPSADNHKVDTALNGGSQAPSGGPIYGVTAPLFGQKAIWRNASFSKVADERKHDSWCTCDGEKELPYRDKRDESRLDIEAQGNPVIPNPHASEKKNGTAIHPEFRVNWDGSDDVKNPKNWPSRQKWAATACIAAFTFISPLASSMVAPALGQITEEFNITNAYESQIVLSIFVLAYAIGPMLLGPLSEMYGRVPIAQGANVFFLLFNTACGFASSKKQLMAFRFLSGLGGSAPLAIGGGVLGDMFNPEERGKAMGMYAMGPLLGPALGPVVGGWVAQKSTWRWMFWATSVTGLIILATSVVWFRETYAPVLLHHKAKAIRKRTGDDRYRADDEGDVDQSIWKKLSANLGRAFGMLFTQPIVQVMALYMGYSYGILYLMLSTYATLFVGHYHESIGISGLNYISLGLGFFIGAPLCGKSGDNMYKKLKKRDPENQGKPEFRMPIVIPFSCLVPVGLLVYGWSAQTQTHWIVPNIGALIFGIGTIAAFQCVTTYLVDTYARYAASAVAAVTILRSLMGFALPLFAPVMYKALGYGWGNTVLAGAALGLGVPVPVLLWFFGERLRKHSSLAMSAKPPANGRGPVPSGNTHGPRAPNSSATRVFELNNVHNSYMDAAPSPIVRNGRPR